MAVSRTWTNQEGQRQEKTVWFRVTAWRKLAETVSQYLTKGRQVLVVGELEEAQAYTDREGNPRASLEVTALTVRFLGSRGDSMGTTGSTETSAAPSSSSTEGSFGDEEIPF